MRSLHQICHDLNNHPFIRQLARRLSSHRACFLVGGAIRDLFLDRSCNDFDFVTPFDPTPLARSLAHDFNGTWFFLDRQRQQSRILIVCDGQTICCDFGILRAASLTSDLLLRDFKINAMALRIRPGIGPDDFIDPLSGLSDLRACRLAICSGGVLRNDPLRIVKGVRHCHVLHFEAAPETIRQMRQVSPQLRRVAGERIRKELGQILGIGSPGKALRQLIESGTAQAVFGRWITEIEPLQLNRSLERFERNFLAVGNSGYGNFLRQTMRYEFESDLSRRAVLYLAVILRHSPDQNTKELISFLKLARGTGRALENYLQINPSQLMERMAKLGCGYRGRYWWVSRLSHDPLGCLIMAACYVWGHSREKALDALSLAEEYAAAEPLEDFVDGKEICRILGVEPGPRVGEALRALRLEEIAGRVENVQQAYVFLETWDQKSH